MNISNRDRFFIKFDNAKIEVHDIPDYFKSYIGQPVWYELILDKKTFDDLRNAGINAKETTAYEPEEKEYYLPITPMLKTKNGIVYLYEINEAERKKYESLFVNKSNCTCNFEVLNFSIHSKNTSKVYLDVINGVECVEEQK